MQNLLADSLSPKASLDRIRSLLRDA
jgi:hypothetical protein